MDYLSSSSTFAVTQLLTGREKQVLKKLPEDLQRHLTELLSAGIGKESYTARLVLQLAVITDPIPSRDRFFLYVARDEDPMTHAYLHKIKRIVEMGFFADLIKRVDCPTKEYHSQNTLHEIVDVFFRAEFKKNVRNKNEAIVARELGNYSPDSLRTVAYDKIQKCRHFYRLSPLINEYLKFDGAEESYIKRLYKHLNSLQQIEYGTKFSEYERLKSIQILFRIGNPNNHLKFRCYSELDVDDFVYQVNAVKDKAGEEALRMFFESIEKSDEYKYDEIIRGATLLSLCAGSPSFFDSIDIWHQRGCKWTELFEILETEVERINFDAIDDLAELDGRIIRFENDPTVLQPLCKEDLTLIKEQYITVNRLCAEFSHYTFNQLIAAAQTIREKALHQPINSMDRLALIALSRLAIRLHFGIYPYCTQILALLGVLVRENSRQAQVKTGEGKSTIVAMWAFVKAMECNSVDIITSARYLAMRDQAKFELFFKRCGITTGHICHDQKLPKHFEAQVLYGPAFDFEFALMQEMLYRHKLFEMRLSNPYVKRNFDCVCVDESDNLLIDAANTGAQMGFPAEVSYDWVYAPLLSFMKKVMDPNSEATPQEQHLFARFKIMLEGESLKELLSQLEQGLAFEVILTLYNRDMEKELIVSSMIRLAKQYLSSHVGVQHKEVSERVEDGKIYRWLISAYVALFKSTEGVDYAIKNEINKKGKVKRKVQIVELKTGRISEKSRWSNGTHEFLEVKHDISVKKESLNPLSFSHTVFYSQYKTITALTGTAERLQTREIYGIESFDVPPHKPLARKDEPVQVTNGQQAHFNAILNKIDVIVKQQRPILVLCENIRDTDILRKAIEKQGFDCQLLNEMQEELEHHVVSQAGTSGRITIATNAAGRGTDIILTEESLKVGGLHVLLTFYPGTEREELQDIGRAGRQGQPGSSSMIIDRASENIRKYFDEENSPLSDGELIEFLRKQRSVNEIKEAKAQFARAGIEAFVSGLTKEFYQALRVWSEKVEEGAFLNFQTQRLNTMKLRYKRDFDFTHLADGDAKLANECVDLLGRPTELLEWKLFFTKVIVRIRENMIRKWALDFYHPFQAMLNEQSSEIKAKNKIKAMFNQQKKNFEKYISADGLGIFTYLNEITTLNF